MDENKIKDSGKTPKIIKYTCESVERQRLQVSVALKAEALGKNPEGGPEVIENWVKFCCQKAAEEGRLMSDIQYQDFVTGRKLAVGDRCRYIGPSREETSSDGGVSKRPAGQIGVIAAESDSILTFYPHEPVHVTLPNGNSEDKIVNLQVKIGTAGCLQLERLSL